MALLMHQNPTVFIRAEALATYRLDTFFVDMNARPEAVVDVTRYLCGLFSHRRVDHLWKGMLRVDLDVKAVDDIASAAIVQASALAAQSGGGP